MEEEFYKIIKGVGIIKNIIKMIYLSNKNKDIFSKPSKTKPIQLVECIGCGLCVSKCPTNAIKIFDFRETICSVCGTCLEICPNNAIIKDRFTIDESKCMKCGICISFCPIPIIKKEIPKPKTPVILKDRCNSCGLCDCEAIDVLNKEIDPEKCKLCLKCIDRCSLQAILTPDEYVNSLVIKVDIDSCIFCRECEEVCPIRGNNEFREG
ncbi:4Fe-4S binding protein [Methanocaldococcus sp.]|uniref:4Fe-4S binding protein n=1 Tax=Methanocaldococcus sp. TaxID=2152917 RepID=UPI0026048CBA|nr:4Fe-4S binding protein [Methanocaldococcus sp.]MCQ6254405.1 4Fe-4S binding protein [Methanocaldococcus sp.]